MGRVSARNRTANVSEHISCFFDPDRRSAPGRIDAPVPGREGLFDREKVHQSDAHAKATSFLAAILRHCVLREEPQG